MYCPTKMMVYSMMGYSKRACCLLLAILCQSTSFHYCSKMVIVQATFDHSKYYHSKCFHSMMAMVPPKPYPKQAQSKKQ